jgi:hypothetical protein
MSLDHVAYYRRRAGQERALAMQSTSPRVAKIHEELAQGYEMLVKNAAFLPPVYEDDDDEG